MRRAVLLLGMGALLLAGEVRAQWVVTDSGQPGPEHHQHVGQYRAHFRNGHQYRTELCGNSEDFTSSTRNTTMR